MSDPLDLVIGKDSDVSCCQNFKADQETPEVLLGFAVIAAKSVLLFSRARRVCVSDLAVILSTLFEAKTA